jgi:hypothetical protein
MPKFVIEVRTKGFANAKAEIQKTAEQTRKFARDSNKGAGATAAFRREASKLRNNMLLVSFAMAGAAATIGQFVTAAASIEKVKLRLEGLMGSTEAAAEAFDVFNEIAKRTPQNIEELASAGAQLEAFGIDSKAALTAVTDLANFMGRDVKLAAFAMGRAFSGGAAASEILKEAGITNVVALSQNIDDLTKLTLPEFRSALFNTLIDPAARIAGSSDRVADSLQGMISTLQDSVFNLRAEVGDKFLPTIKDTIGALTRFTDSMDPSSLMRMVSSLGILAAGLRLQRAGWIGAAAGASTFFLALQTGMKRIAVLFVIDTALRAFGDLIDKLNGTTDAQEELRKAVADNKDLTQEYANELNSLAEQSGSVATATEEMQEAQQKLADSIHKSEEALLIRLVNMQHSTELDKASTIALINEKRALSMLEVERLVAIDNLIAHNEQKAEAVRLAKKEADTILKESVAAQKEEIRLKKEKMQLDEQNRIASLDNLDAFTSVFQESLLIQAELDGATDLEIAKMRLRTELAQNLSDAIGGSSGSYTNYIESLEAGMSAEELANGVTEGAIENQRMLAYAIVDNFNKKVALAEVDAAKIKSDEEAAEKVKKHQENMDQFAQSILTAAGAIKMLGDASQSPEQKLSALMQTLGGVLMMVPGGQVPGALLQAGSMFVGHTGGLIQDSGIQRFATGGMVQGQDNVPIMAQAGEFIMQRSAVDNIGVQNLAAMNSGQTSTGVTVNIQGNMIGNDEFIRDNLIPQLNKAANQELA